MSAPEPVPPRFPGRAAFAISEIYYYAVAVVGVGVMIGGAIATLIGLRALVFSGPSDTTRQSVRGILSGLAFLAPAAALCWWHLREAKRRESRDMTGEFWGRSLYFHWVALIAVLIALGGAIASLTALIDLTLPQCFGDLGFAGSSGFTSESPCFPSHGDAVRSIVNGIIILLVPGVVFAWHIKQGRAMGREPAGSPATSPSPPPPSPGAVWIINSRSREGLRLDRRCPARDPLCSRCHLGGTSGRSRRLPASRSSRIRGPACGGTRR